MLARQDRGDFWFFVIISGHVGFSRGSEPLRSLGPGTHFGHETIVGLRPQPATARTTEKCTLLVLGAQYLLSLLADCPGFQRQLFPDIAPREYRAFAKRMHVLGRAEWREVAVRNPIRTIVGGERANVVRRERVRGRPLSMREAAARFAEMPFGALPAVPPPAVPPAPLPRWVPLAGAAALAIALGTALFTYHPPRAVVTAGRPIDVVRDIDVAGRRTGMVTGRYLLLSVRVSRPTLAGYLAALAHGARTIPVGSVHVSRAEQAEAEEIGRGQYFDSQRTAIAVAEAASGVAGGTVSIHIRDRGLVGPSGGLVYALALNDLLSGRDCTAGRVVAATGALDGNGGVSEVGWVGVKMGSARHAHASIVVVPADERDEARRTGGQIVAATTMRQAVDALCRSAPAKHA